MFSKPTRFTVRMAVAGPCGDGYFSMPINTANQDASIATLMNAAHAGNDVRVFVYYCQGQRNLIDTVNIFF